MQPRFLRQATIDSLLVDFAEAKLHYRKGDQDWFLARFQAEHGLRSTRFDFPDFALSCGNGEATDVEYAETDRENVRRIYTAMRDLPLAVAIDQRFWSGLAHTDFWDYVQYRRRSELAAGDDNAVKISYFFTLGPRRSAHVNCLSRLWWAGRITYDARNSRDPFELADLITERAFASTILLLSSNNFISNPALALGLLDAVKQERDDGVEIRRKHFVGPAKYLNRMGGITILDYLSREQVRTTVQEYYATPEFESYTA